MVSTDSHAAMDRTNPLLTSCPPPAAASDVTIRTYPSDDIALIGLHAEGGKTLNHGRHGSSAFRRPNDPPNLIWTLGDRGPNIACSGRSEMTGSI
jgi:hypothetical protein